MTTLAIAKSTDFRLSLNLKFITFVYIDFFSMNSSAAYFEKYAVAPCPSRDYYGIKVFQNIVSNEYINFQLAQSI